MSAGASSRSAGGVVLEAAPWIAAVAAFAILFRRPIADTVTLWWTNPDWGHGLLLVPVAGFLAWRGGFDPARKAQPLLGAVILTFAVLLRYLSGLAAELFTMRLSVLGALFGIVIFLWGIRQLGRWWLPATLLVLSMPLPEVLTGSLALPLQFRASSMGAALLNWRHVPARLDGNVIVLGQRLADGSIRPVTQLFVTEACSGLRSLSALLALGFLIGGLRLRTPWGRALLVIAAIPIAMVLNSVRIFLTGFTVFYVDQALGEGLMHYTEGWAMFLAAFLVLGAATWLVARSEAPIVARRAAVS